MPTITFLPDNKTFEVAPGTTVLDAALENDIDLDHACGGSCACTTCHVIVEEGMTNLSDIEENEDDKLDEAEDVTLKSRLGCQAHIETGHVTVRIPLHVGPVQRGH